MSLTQFVIVPLDKFQSMEQMLQDKSQKEQPFLRDEHATQTVPEPVLDKGKNVDDSFESSDAKILVESDDEESDFDSKHMIPLSKATKKLGINRKKFFEARINKYLKMLEDYGIGSLKLPNLPDLIDQALTQTPRREDHEQSFYNFLIQHNLIHWIKNKTIISRYIPYWYRI